MASEAKYHVFLSFRGEDTRDNFISHLYEDLHRRKGIKTFIDSDDLLRGEKISESLLKAIEESKIAIIVFSEGYASSTWCLEEVAKIVDCQESRGLIVLPVFYDVDPSVVRKQAGSFGEAFAAHEQRFKKELGKVQRWRSALTKAADLSGFDSQVTRSESSLVEEIVKQVLERLNHMTPSNNKDLVGVESRINKIESLLHSGPKDVFLSFRGEDTRHNFISHLYKDLHRRKGIETFIDSNEIFESLLKAIEESKIAIEESKIAIIVFSRFYASSTWCLEELAKIVDCQESRGLIVLPVFYHVHPSDVRKQTGSFGEAFAWHEQRFKKELGKVQRWRSALTKAADLSGFDSQVTRLCLRGCEGGQELVDSVFCILTSSLTFLDLCECQFTKLPDSLCDLSGLQTLDLCGNNRLECIPANISSLTNLEFLDVSYCERLQFLPELPELLLEFYVHNCTLLEARPDSLCSLFHGANEIFNFANCFKMDPNTLVTTLVGLKSKFPYFEDAGVCCPGNEIPEYFSCQNMGSSITLKLPLDCMEKSQGNCIRCMMCIVVTPRDHHPIDRTFRVGLKYTAKSKDGKIRGQLLGFSNVWKLNHHFRRFYMASDHVLFWYDFSIEEEWQLKMTSPMPLSTCRSTAIPKIWIKKGKIFTSSGFSDSVTIDFYIDGCDNLQVKKCGVELLVDQDERKKQMEGSRGSDKKKQKMWEGQGEEEEEKKEEEEEEEEEEQPQPKRLKS